MNALKDIPLENFLPGAKKVHPNLFRSKKWMTHGLKVIPVWVDLAGDVYNRFGKPKAGSLWHPIHETEEDAKAKVFSKIERELLWDERSLDRSIRSITRRKKKIEKLKRLIEEYRVK